MGEGGQSHAPAALAPWNGPGAPYTGDWVGPRTGPYVCGEQKISPPHSFELRPAQVVGNRNTF